MDGDATAADGAARRRRRDLRVFLVAAVVHGLLAIPVDRDRTSHVELREAYPWEIAATVAAMLMCAFVIYGESRFGMWSFLRPVRALLRDVAVVCLSVAFVFSVYGLSLLFR